MHHDKKNMSADTVNFTLLSNVGAAEIDHQIADDEIKTALDIYCDLIGA